MSAVNECSSHVAFMGRARWLGASRRRWHFGMYATYYDASGADSQPMVTTVGLFATVDRWERLEQEWKDALTRARIPYVHIQDFVHRNPPYAHFKEDEDLRVEFIRTANNLLADGNLRVIAMSVAPEDFRTVNKTYKLVESFGGPWGLCTCMCATAADIDWRAHVEPDALIAHVHERGERGGRVVDILAEANIDLQFRDKVDPHTKEWFVPFQAADFVAWEIRKAMQNLRNGNPVARQSLRGLYELFARWDDPLMYTQKIAPPRALVAMCERYAHLIEKR